jgi:outer membrane PBP1 activator LpoA protein
MLKHYRKLVCLICLFFVLLTGCSSAPNQMRTNDNVFATPKQMSANDYLLLAQKNQSTQQDYYLIKASGAYIDERQLLPAARLIAQLKQKQLDPNNYNLLQLIIAKYQLQKNNAAGALNILNNMQATSLDQDMQIERLKTLAQAYMLLNNWQQSIITLDNMLQLQTKTTQQNTVTTIWQILLAQPNALINSVTSDDQQLNSWIALAKLSRSASSAEDLQSKLISWQQSYPNSPANALLPPNLATLNIVPLKLQKIALLLPLSGKYASSGKAVRNGFIAAYYADSSSKPQLNIIDTATGNVEDLYQQAIQNGAQLVVGPLLQENVATIAEHQVSVPTIALNNINSKSPSNNLYQFSLSPNSEARQIAMRAWRSQHKNALIIMPNNTWGATIAKSFTDKWQALGGTVSATATYSDIQDLKQDIMHALNIDASYARAAEIKKITSNNIRMIPERRQDIDMIFVISNPEFARQIKPMLNFYFAGSIDTYALSDSFNSKNNTDDLSGMIFCDQPWIINRGQLNDELKSLASSIDSTWPGQSNQTKRLNSLGIDAYSLTKNLPRLQYFSAFGLPSASGTLFLDQNNSIVRQLNWATIDNGQVKLLL